MFYGRSVQLLSNSGQLHGELQSQLKQGRDRVRKVQTGCACSCNDVLVLENILVIRTLKGMFRRVAGGSDRAARRRRVGGRWARGRGRSSPQRGLSDGGRSHAFRLPVLGVADSTGREFFGGGCDGFGKTLFAFPIRFYRNVDRGTFTGPAVG